MAFFFDSLEPFKEEAENLFQKGIRPIASVFSGSTYQFLFENKEDAPTSEQGAAVDEEGFSQNGYWVFVQLSSKNDVEDIFCTCPASSLESDRIGDQISSGPGVGCIHMALALTTIFAKKTSYGVVISDTALHQRFYERSPIQTLFSLLFHYFCTHQAVIPGQTRIKGTDHIYSDPSGEIILDGQKNQIELFKLKGKKSGCHISADHSLFQYCRTVLKEADQKEIEESSIQFSRFSDSEITAWRKGEASQEVKYELSPVIEMAKALFLVGEGVLLYNNTEDKLECVFDFAPDTESCTLSMTYGKLFSIQAFLKDVSYIAPLFHTLANCGKSVFVSPKIYMLSQIDPISCRILSPLELQYRTIGAKKELPLWKKGAKMLSSGWMLSEDQKILFFDDQKKEMVETKSIQTKEDIEAVLNALFDREEIENVHSVPQLYEIRADLKNKKFYIDAYIDIGGQKRSLAINSDFLGNRWIVQSRGTKKKGGALLSQIECIRIEGVPSFPCGTTEILGEDIDTIILEHQMWFQKYKGFQPHPFSYKGELSYKVDPLTCALYFFSNGSTAGARGTKDRHTATMECGSWIWRENEGFFQNNSIQDVSQAVYRHKGVEPPLNVPIPPHQVAHLLQSAENFLHCVPSFFCKTSPIESSTLKIDFDKKLRKIEIYPIYVLKNGICQEEMRIYGEYGFLPGIGFFRIPLMSLQNGITRSIEEGNREEWDRFFLDQLPRYRLEYTLAIDPQLEKPTELKLYCQSSSEEIVDEEIEHFSHEWKADFYWMSDLGVCSFDEVVHALEQGMRFVPSQAGLIDTKDERFLWLQSYVKSNRKKPAVTSGVMRKKAQKSKAQKSKSLHLKAFDFFRIQAHDTVHFIEDGTQKNNYSTAIQKLLQAQADSEPVLNYLKSELRPYQKHGLDWLWFLYTAKLSGLLCDDMGVGKTHQAMALMAAVHADIEPRRDGKLGGRFLIVCPTSLVWHWKEKLSKFLPDLTVMPYFGEARSLDDIRGDWNIFLTTYGIWRNEVAFLRTLSFDVAVFDELQIAKNHVSRIWAALSQVQASMRIGLTGTPIENHLRELKALFDLILPGYLPDDSLFREWYVRPIDKGISDSRQALLARSIKPFVLRRKKNEVLPDLPEKTEELFMTELLPDQKRLYREVAAMQGEPLIQQLHNTSSPIPYMHIFALLSSLKQITNHPASYLKDVANYKQYDSGKWQVFLELIEEAKESGQKVVVFSQYLNMLDIMGAALTEMGIRFTEIRGRTRSRGAAIEQFQKDPETLVFLGSLQAAGLGIDLTAASIVIHYDRWWNAARENQATDRVHRMGQARGVQVIKMVTKDTIEERIDMMIARKSTLLDEMVHYDDHQVVKKLTRDELLEVLNGL